MPTDFFITGTSRGLGLGLTRAFLKQGRKGIGLSRNPAPLDHPGYQHIQADLSAYENISSYLQPVFLGCSRLQILVLNAALITPLHTAPETTHEEFAQLMDINVWANKALLDAFISAAIEVKQVVLISSGVAVHPLRGQAAYCLSKAALNMLAQLYAEEMPDTHVCALAPGVIDTPMQAQLSHKIDPRFPATIQLSKLRGTATMPDENTAGKKLAALLPLLPAKIETGGFAAISYTDEGLALSRVTTQRESLML